MLHLIGPTTRLSVRLLNGQPAGNSTCCLAQPSRYWWIRLSTWDTSAGDGPVASATVPGLAPGPVTVVVAAGAWKYLLWYSALYWPGYRTAKLFLPEGIFTSTPLTDAWLSLTTDTLMVGRVEG